jgi:hypothetical protein
VRNGNKNRTGIKERKRIRIKTLGKRLGELLGVIRDL